MSGIRAGSSAPGPAPPAVAQPAPATPESPASAPNWIKPRRSTPLPPRTMVAESAALWNCSNRARARRLDPGDGERPARNERPFGLRLRLAVGERADLADEAHLVEELGAGKDRAEELEVAGR